MRYIIIISFSLTSNIIFGQFEKSFDDIEEYQISNKIQEALESNSHNYCAQLTKSLLTITTMPDRLALQDGLECSIKARNQQQVVFLLRIAQQLNYQLSEDVGTTLQLQYPAIFEDYSFVFKEQKEEVLNFELANHLAQMGVDDQVCRSVTYKPIVEKAIELGYTVKENHDLTCLQVDSINLEKLNTILKTNPNLGKKEVGKFGMLSVFFIIQHGSNHSLYKDKMDQWLKSKDISGSNYALFTDRHHRQIGKPQIYGSQFSCEGYLEIEDLATINERRMKMGMISIERYVRYFDKIWEYYIADCKQSIKP